MTSRRRGRSDSMIKMMREQKESKLRYDEAIAHDKSGNYMKALDAYNRQRHNKVSRVYEQVRKPIMDVSESEPEIPKTPKRSSRLDSNRESELMQRFVRMNLDQNEEIADSERPTDHEQANEKEMGKSDEDGSRSRKMSTTSLSSTKPLKLLTKQINQELNKKRKKRKGRRKNEEIYTDKDRAAAMSMGSKDIKISLKAKHKQDRSKALSIPEEAEPGNFIALGTYETKSGNLKLAIQFYSKALELNPKEKNALVARSQCYILMGQPDLALKDAETALELEKKFSKAIYQKAESLYYLGEFEHSLMYYHRGLRIRPDLEGFKLGVHKAQKAIENAIGSSMISKQNTPDSKVSKKSISSKRSKSSSRIMQLPKQLCVEMKYLDGLLKHPDIKCKFMDDSDVTPKIQEAVDYLSNRQEFWRAQLPPKFR